MKVSTSIKLVALAITMVVSPIVWSQDPDDVANLKEIPIAAVQGGGQQVTVPNLSNATVERVLVKVGGAMPADAIGQIKDGAEKAFGFGPGDAYDALGLEKGLAAIRSIPGVGAVRLRLFEAGKVGQIVVLVEVDTVDPSTLKPEKIGVLAGMPKAFPVLYGDKKSLVLAGGLFSASAFTSFGAWFGEGKALNDGNPLARRPSGGNPFWGEGSGSLSLTGITTLSPDLYTYGQFSYLGTITAGQDVYEDRTRTKSAVELANAGLAWARKTPKGERQALNVRFGRQNYMLGEGMLIFGGAQNVGERGTAFLIPRQAFEESVLVQGRLNDFKLEAFSLNPNEAPEIETETKVEGVNLEYANPKGTRLGVSYLRVPDSKATYLSPAFTPLEREGLQVWNYRARIPLGENFAFSGEYARQTHEDYSMLAEGYTGTLSYSVPKAGWKPTFSYRYSSFTGDNPSTSRFERFDPLLGGGTIDTWANSFVFAFVVPNSNVQLHRIRCDFSTDPKTKFSAQWTSLTAARKFNAGSAAPLTVLSDRYLGHEFGVAAQHFLNQNTILIGAAAHGIPGAGLKAVDAKNSWTYLQVGLIFAF